MRRHRRLSLLVPLLLPLGPALAEDPPPEDEDRGRALYLQHCATCHGETGDGQGVTELDRPARSFRDGGFSFGNTPEALFRTISTGIPGTPMPGFDTAIDEAGRRDLARYVRSLGPPETETDPSAAVLEVGAVPLVVRGHLPPIREGAESWPRGLLLGTTSGLTFEYRADDVRLLGLRQGPFVRRTDWSGRGGTPLEPLGPVVHLVRDGAPGALFQLEAEGERRDLAAKLRSTWVRGGDVGLSYALVGDGGTEHARVDETVAAVATSKASGFERRFTVAVSGGPAAGVLVGDLVAPIGPPVEGELDLAGRVTRVYANGEGLFQVVLVDGDAVLADGRLRFADATGGTTTVTTLLAAEWTDELRAGLAEELSR